MVETGTSSKPITVAEDGNKRKIISNEDVVQATNDLAEWFKANCNNMYESQLKNCGPASVEDISKLD